MNLKSTKSIDEHSSNTRLASPWGHLIILAKTSGEEIQYSIKIMNFKIFSKEWLDVFLIINSSM